MKKLLLFTIFCCVFFTGCNSANQANSQPKTNIKVGDQVLYGVNEIGYFWRTVEIVEKEKITLSAEKQNRKAYVFPSQVATRAGCGTPPVSVGDRVIYRAELRDDVESIKDSFGKELPRVNHFSDKVAAFSGSTIEVEVPLNPGDGFAFPKSKNILKPITYWCVFEKDSTLGGQSK